MDQIDRQHDHHQQEHQPHDRQVVLLTHQELRQRDAHVEGSRPVRVAELQALLLRLLVAQALVGLRDHDELGAGFGVVGVAVGVVKEGQFAVGLLDAFDRGVLLDPKDLVGVEAFDLFCGAEDGLGADYDAIDEAGADEDLSGTGSTLSRNLKVTKAYLFSFLNLPIFSRNWRFSSSWCSPGMWLKGLRILLRIDQVRGTATMIRMVM